MNDKETRESLFIPEIWSQLILKRFFEEIMFPPMPELKVSMSRKFILNIKYFLRENVYWRFYRRNPADDCD